MQRQPVESSMIRAVGYDPATETLEVEFNTGKVWQYLDVPAEVHRQLMASDSHGSYMRSLVIDVYQDRQIKTPRTSRRHW